MKALIWFLNIVQFLFLIPLFSFGQSDLNSFYIGDALPDAPKLAARGDFKVGVKTIQVVNPCLLYTSPSPRDS